MDIAIHNKALLMKNLHKFFNMEDLPWVNLIWNKYYASDLPRDRMIGSSWWKAHLKLLPDYKQLATCKAGNGRTTKLWFDTWVDKPLVQLFPELHSFANNDKVSLNMMINARDIFEHFHTPLSAEAFNQLNELHTFLQQQSKY